LLESWIEGKYKKEGGDSGKKGGKEIRIREIEQELIPIFFCPVEIEQELIPIFFCPVCGGLTFNFAVPDHR